MKTVPNPGSEEAQKLGCLCPVLDNGHGQGSMWGPGTFIMTEGCKLHNDAVRRAKVSGKKSSHNTNDT